MKLIAYLIGLILSVTATAGEITHHTFSSETLGGGYAYNIYLPDGYQGGDLRYPVLYLLHGSFGDENSWPVDGKVRRITDRLIAEGRMPPAIIVMPGAKSWWVDGYNEAARTAFFKDLIPHIDTHYRTVAEREGRVVGGLSAGGYGAVNFVLEYPEMFAAAAALSPALSAIAQNGAAASLSISIGMFRTPTRQS